MKYRQWKKNYKKRHGVNPPASIDKRKQCKQAVRAIKALANVDLASTINRMADAVTDALANFMRGIGGVCDRAGTMFRDTADALQPLEIDGCGLIWEVKPVVCDYGVYENCAWNGSSELKLMTNSRRAAEKIVEIMQQDQLEHMRCNYPERVKKKTDAADALVCGFKIQAPFCDEGGVFE